MTPEGVWVRPALMRFNVATVQSAALNACNQVSVQPDWQTGGGGGGCHRWSGGWLETLRWCQELGLRLEDAAFLHLCICSTLNEVS